MSNFAQQALSQLQAEKGRLLGEMKRLEQAIGALKGLAKYNGAPGGLRARPRLSVAARKRIAAAQRLRWAKVRMQQKKAA